MTELERFFQQAWRDFLQFSAWSESDLQDAIVASGLGEFRPATVAGENYDIGEQILVLTEAGKRAVAAR